MSTKTEALARDLNSYREFVANGLERMAKRLRAGDAHVVSIDGYGGRGRHHVDFDGAGVLYSKPSVDESWHVTIRTGAEDNIALRAENDKLRRQLEKVKDLLESVNGI